MPSSPRNCTMSPPPNQFHTYPPTQPPTHPTPLPLLLHPQVFILKRAVAGVSNEVRAFHNWEEEYKKHYREPPKREMVLWRQRMADCFDLNFTQVRLWVGG